MPKRLLPSDYYRIARKLLPEMDDIMRQAVEDLLSRAEAGEKTDNRLVEVITESKVLQKKLREALELGEDKTMGSDFSQLAGDVNSPDARIFICPVADHDFTRRIQKAGDNPGSCPVHKVALIPIDQKRGK